MGGEGAKGFFVGSASSVRSFPDQGHISAVEEKGGRAMMALSPSLSPLSALSPSLSLAVISQKQSSRFGLSWSERVDGERMNEGVSQVCLR